MVSPLAAEVDVNLKVSSPAPPFITLTALLAVMVSLPEPVLTFSIPQIVSLPVWELDAVPFDNAPDPRLTVTFARRRRHVERVDAGAAAAFVAEVDVVAVADFGHDQIVSGAAEYGIVTRSGGDQVVALIAEDTIRSGIAVDDVVVRPGKHLVVAGSGEDHVPSGAATDEIAALSGRDRIGTAIAHGNVVSRKGDDIVVPAVPISTSA